METAKIFNGIESEMTNDSGLFIKEVAKTGNYTTMNGDDVEITIDYLMELVDNFKINPDKVFVPLGHPRMQEDANGLYYYANPLQNCGWVKDLWTQDGSLFAKFEITEPTIAEKIKSGTIADDSIGAYTTSEGKNILEHIALTLTPAITNLQPFEPVAFESSKRKYQVFERAIKKENEMADKIDLEKERIELEKSFADKELAIKTEFEKKANDTMMALELAQKSLKEYQTKELESVVKSLISEKKIKPSQEESALELITSNRVSFEKFVAENKAVEETQTKELENKEEAIESIKSKDFKKLGKEDSIKALEKLSKGKLIIV